MPATTARPGVGVVLADDHIQLLTAGTDVLAADPARRAALVERAGDGDPRPLGETRLLAPVWPRTLRDFLTFEEHLEGSLAVLGCTEPHPSWYKRWSPSPRGAPSCSRRRARIRHLRGRLPA